MKPKSGTSAARRFIATTDLNDLTVGVVGGGIGGLTAALAFADRGASVSVFEDNNNDNEDIDERKIQHKSDDKDTISDDTAGYIQTMVGDSGGPYWTYDAVLDNKMRATVIAIHNDSVGRRLRVTVDKSKKCRMTSTKITEDILVWIKEISGTALCIKD